MSSRDINLLGIDLSDEEIRVVEVRRRGPRFEVVRSGWAPSPAGAVLRGAIREAPTLGLAVRRLLESMEVKAAPAAAFGLSGAEATARTIFLPPSPAREISALVAGEVNYQQIVGEGGAYGYFPLNRTESDHERDGSQVVVMGAAAEAIAAIREVARTAGLSVARVEPAPIAPYRALVSQPGCPDAVLMLAVRETSADLVFGFQGDVSFLRRIDVGSASLRDEASTLARLGPAVADPARSRSGSGASETAKFDELMVEIQRSLEYLAREDARFGQVDRLYLSVDAVELVPLRDALSACLATGVDLFAPLPEGDSFRYATAYGLAIPDERVAPIDLYREERSAGQLKEMLRNLKGSIAVAACSLLFGVAGYAIYGHQIAVNEAAARSLSARATAIEGQALTSLEAQAKEEKRYRLLATDGVPIAPLTSHLARGLAPGVGLSALTIGPDGRIVLTGEATSEAAMLQTLEDLKRSPLLSDLTISSFDRQDTRLAGGISFQFSGSALPLSGVRSGAAAQASATPSTGRYPTPQEVSMR